MEKRISLIHTGGILTSEEGRFRVVGIQDAYVFLCQLDVTYMNIIMPSLGNIMSGISLGKYSYEEDADPRVVDPEKLSSYQRQQYEKYKSAISKIDKEYSRHYTDLCSHRKKPVIESVMKEFDIPYTTMRRKIREYLQSGRREYSLVPKGRSKDILPRVRTHTKNRRGKEGYHTRKQDRENYDRAIEEYNKKHAQTVLGVYIWMLGEFYHRELAEHEGAEDDFGTYPSFCQFQHYFYRHTDRQQRRIHKLGKRSFRNNERVLIGASNTDVHYPGEVVEADANIFDIVLVSDANPSQVIGKPVVYAMRDVYSRAIVAVSIGFDKVSVSGLSGLMLNLGEDKKECCKRYGINLDNDDDFPAPFLPDRIRCDNGSDFTSKEFHLMCARNNISIDTVPPAMGSAKGLIESVFNQIQSEIKKYSEGKGWTKSPDHQSHPNKDAIMTLREFTRIVYISIIALNRRVNDKRPMTPDMVCQDVAARPMDIWRYGIENINAPRSIPDKKQYFFSLLCQGTAMVWRNGVHFKGLIYRGKGDSQVEDMIAKTDGKRKRLGIRYDPRNDSCIYYEHDGIVETLEIMKTIPEYADYEGMPFDELEQYMNRKKETNDIAKQKDTRIAVAMDRTINSLFESASARREYPVSDKNMREERTIERIRAAKENSAVGMLEKIETEENNAIAGEKEEISGNAEMTADSENRKETAPETEDMEEEEKEARKNEALEKRLANIDNDTKYTKEQKERAKEYVRMNLQQ